MKSQLEVKESFRQEEWYEGKIIPIAVGSYRHRLVAHCTQSGRQTAVFADGQEHKYVGYFEFINGKGEWSREGAGMVPVLPNGQILMVVEQRPAQSRFPGRTTVARIGDKIIDLKNFGLHSSLELPGGSVEPGQGLRAGFISELTGETGIPDQYALWYSRLRPVCLFGSDLAHQQNVSVVFLSGLAYEPYVAEDGGLQVFALSEEEVDYNIWSGLICSGQAALMPWAFYKEVKQARGDPVLERELKAAGYLGVERVRIAKAK